jgi:hypothetical protein
MGRPYEYVPRLSRGLQTMMTASEKQEIERLAEALAEATGESPVEALLSALNEESLTGRRPAADGFRIKAELERLLKAAREMAQAYSSLGLTPSPASGLRKARLRRFLEEEIWPSIPPSLRGKPISRAEREEILGYGPEGV